MGVLVWIGAILIFSLAAFCVLLSGSGGADQRLNRDAVAEVRAIVPDFQDPQKYDPMWTTNQSQPISALIEQQAIQQVVASRTARGLTSYLRDDPVPQHTPVPRAPGWLPRHRAS